jgi:hypothetical protein
MRRYMYQEPRAIHEADTLMNAAAMNCPGPETFANPLMAICYDELWVYLYYSLVVSTRCEGNNRERRT